MVDIIYGIAAIVILLCAVALFREMSGKSPGDTITTIMATPKYQVAVIIVVVLVLCVVGYLAYQHNEDREARLQQATTLTVQQAQDINSLQNQLNLSRQNAEELANAVKKAESGKVQPVVHFTVQAPTVQQAVADVSERINTKDPTLPPAALDGSDRTAVAPQKLTDKQKQQVKVENEKRKDTGQLLLNEEFGVGVYKFNAYRNWEWTAGYGQHGGDHYVPLEVQRNFSKDAAFSYEQHLLGKKSGWEAKYTVKTDKLLFLF